MWSLICAFCIVFFEETEGAEAKRELIGLLGSKGEIGQQIPRGFGQLENRRGEGDKKKEEEDPYTNIEMLLRKGTLQQNNSFVSDGDEKDKMKNAAEPDFDFSLGSWFESLLYTDYEDESQDISSHEHDDTHGDGHGHSEDNYGSQEMGHNSHSHFVSERGQEERHGHGHGGKDRPDKKKQSPTSSHAASVSMATWLISFSSITVISVVRFIKTVLQGSLHLDLYSPPRLVWQPWVRCLFCRDDIVNPYSPCWSPWPWEPSWGTP